MRLSSAACRHDRPHLACSVKCIKQRRQAGGQDRQPGKDLRDLWALGKALIDQKRASRDLLMFSSMFDASHVAEVALRTLIIYSGLLLGMRLAGKREVGQMKPFDLVTLLIISNAVQNAMVGQDSSLVGGLTAALVILISNFVVARLRHRYTLAQRVFEGSPTLLVHDGQFVSDHLRHEQL